MAQFLWVNSYPWYQDFGTQSGRVSLGRVLHTYYLTGLGRVFVSPLAAPELQKPQYQPHRWLYPPVEAHIKFEDNSFRLSITDIPVDLAGWTSEQ